MAIFTAAHAQHKADAKDADGVVVTALRDAVAKSYRKMIAGMDRFEKRHQLAPAASLRFKLLPRHRETDMDDIALEIVGDSFTIPVELASDRTFTLQRHRLALNENAAVMPNRKARSMRLECEVGMEARLVSNYRPLLFGWLDALVAEGPEYCGRSAPRYLFFADRPLFSVTLVAGARRETLPVDRLYAGASRDPEWKDDLPYCDCEVLVERAYFVPLGDRSWPDDTGEAAVVDFDSGYEVWLYREKLSELVLLFAPSGVVTKTRIR